MVGSHMLILDDDHDAADLLAALISMHDPSITIDVAYGGERAMELALLRRPDTAVLDLEMQGLDGVGVAMALREAYPLAPVFLIALSGNLALLGRLASQTLFDRVVSKPIPVAGLIRLLRG